jgi:hypothetical protein
MNSVAVKNDLCRRTFSGCQVLMTRTVAHDEDRHLILQAVKEFNIFNNDNDPYKEHDFGSFSFNGQTYFWKFDYYDDEYKYFKENGNRVLTIGLMSEY